MYMPSLTKKILHHMEAAFLRVWIRKYGQFLKSIECPSNLKYPHWSISSLQTQIIDLENEVKQLH
ncbi:hypothetical protein TKK_0006872 [Trichogramma kaykai]